MKVIKSKSSFEPDEWLWCLECQRFFQGRDARFDGRAREGCPFPGCANAGFGIGIHAWDAFAGKHWPKKSELRKGLSSASWERKEGEEFESALRNPLEHGIGAALNQDWKRRGEILGIFDRESPSDPTPFSGLDRERLETLLRERFVPPGSLGRYASAEKVIAFMQEWPQVRAGGIAIHPSRKDYRVSLTNLECAIDSVHPDRRDELMTAFEKEFGSESTMEGDDCEGRVQLWWIWDVE